MPKYFAIPANKTTAEALSTEGVRINKDLSFYLYPSRSGIPAGATYRYPLIELHLPANLVPTETSSPMGLDNLNIILYFIQHKAESDSVSFHNLPDSYDRLVSSSDGTLTPSNIADLFHDYHHPLNNQVPGWFGLMLTGHWNRSHLIAARTLENSIRSSASLSDVTSILEAEYERLVGGGANLEGSYARRIQFALLEIDDVTRVAPAPTAASLTLG